MFEGEKTYVFWIGLIILGFASVVLFTLVWLNAVSAVRGYTFFLGPNIEVQVPFFVAAIVFLLIGLYMVRSGVVKKKEG